MLLGLIDGPDRIVAVRRAALFDVSAEEVCHLMGARKPREPLDASRERGRVSDVQSAGIERVAGQQHAGAPIVNRNTGRLMSGDRENVEHATAQVECGRVVRPAANAKERTHRGGVTSNDRRSRASDELRIARDMIAVTMTVRDDEIDRLSVMSSEPGPDERVDGRGHVDVTGAGVQEQRTVIAEHQVEKRLLVVRAGCLAKDVEVRVVRSHAKWWNAGTVSAAGVPVGVQRSRFESRVQTRWLRAGRDRDKDRGSDEPRPAVTTMDEHGEQSIRTPATGRPLCRNPDNACAITRQTFQELLPIMIP